MTSKLNRQKEANRAARSALRDQRKTLVGTRVVLRRLVEAINSFGEEMFFNGDDRESPSYRRASERVERAVDAAMAHLDATAKPRAPRSVPPPKMPGVFNDGGQR